MTSTPTTQEIFQQFLRGELSQHEAISAIIATTVAHKAKGGPQSGLAIRKPAGRALSPADSARAEAFMEELNRRAELE